MNKLKRGRVRLQKRKALTDRKYNPLPIIFQSQFILAQSRRENRINSLINTVDADGSAPIPKSVWANSSTTPKDLIFSVLDSMPRPAPGSKCLLEMARPDLYEIFKTHPQVVEAGTDATD